MCNTVEQSLKYYAANYADEPMMPLAVFHPECLICRVCCKEVKDCQCGEQQEIVESPF